MAEYVWWVVSRSGEPDRRYRTLKAARRYAADHSGARAYRHTKGGFEQVQWGEDTRSPKARLRAVNSLRRRWLR